MVFGNAGLNISFVLTNMNQIKTISIIEDDIKYGLVLKKLIDSQTDLACISICTSLKKSLNDLAVNSPDVVLLDVQLPDGLGSEYVQVLKKVSPDSLFIICTSFENDDYIFESLKNGASGYLIKSGPQEKIVDAIRDVLNGGAPMSAMIARKVVEYFQVQTNVLKILTFKENELLNLLGEGLLYKEIAIKMNIVLDTVKKHASTIYKKLQVSNKTEAINKLRNNIK